MKTTPEQAFTEWIRGREPFNGYTTIEILELAFHAGAKWAIGELDERMKDTPIADTPKLCETPHNED